MRPLRVFLATGSPSNFHCIIRTLRFLLLRMFCSDDDDESDRADKPLKCFAKN